MKRIKYIFLIGMIIVSILGLLFIATCAADVQGKSKKALLYKVECLDYGKVNSIAEGVENVLGNVPGNVEAITFKPIVDISSKVEVTPYSKEYTKLKYMGNMVWKLTITDADYNKFKIKVTSEEGVSKEYSFKVVTTLELKSFVLLPNGNLKTEKKATIGSDLSVSLVNPAVKVDLSTDITNLKFKIKFEAVGTMVKITPVGSPNPSIELRSEETEIDFATPVVRTLRVYGKDNTKKDYSVFVGKENTTGYSDLAIVNKVAVVDKNTLYIIATVDNSNDDAYIAGSANFRSTQLGDNTNYANITAAVNAGAVKMFKVDGMFRGKYIRVYPIVKPSDPAKYKLDMLIVKDATPNDKSDILQYGAPPYQDADISYDGEKAFVSVDFSVDSANYIVPPPIYLRGRPTNLMWDALPKARLVEATSDPEYTGKYSVMKTRTFIAVNDPGAANGDYTITDSSDDYIAAGNWEWKIGEGVVLNKWLYPAFHFGKKSANVVFSPASAKTSATGRNWAEVDAGEAKPNWNNTFKVGKKYTWYIKDYLKGNDARIMIIEED